MLNDSANVSLCGYHLCVSVASGSSGLCVRAGSNTGRYLYVGQVTLHLRAIATWCRTKEKIKY